MKKFTKLWIKKFPRVLYQIATLDGDHVIGSFYQEQITKVLNQDEFIIEKVLKSTKKHALVKFLGYNKPEWVSKNHITTIKDIQWFIMPKKEIMRLSDKSVLLISNAQSTTEEDHTLTNFSGSIPSNFLNQHKSWKVAVHSCGIHMMLKQPLTPKYENLPSIIQITYENLDILAKTHRLAGLGQFKLDMFKNSLQFYVDREKSYT